MNAPLPALAIADLDIAANALLTGKSQAAIYARIGLAEHVTEHFAEALSLRGEPGVSLATWIDDQAQAFLAAGSREARAFLREWRAGQAAQRAQERYEEGEFHAQGAEAREEGARS